MNSTFKPAAILMAGRMFGFGINFLTPIVLVRMFDQQEFGTYKEVFLLYTTLFGIAQLGMAESLYFFLPLAPEKAGRYVVSSLTGLVCVGLCALAGLQLASSAMGAWLSNPALPQYMGLLGAYLCLTLASAPLEIVMIARGRYLRASITYGISDVARNVFILVAAFAHGKLREILIASVVFAGIRFSATLIYATQEFGSDLRLELNAIRRQLAYALPFALFVGVDMLSSSLPQYVIAHRFDAATFALFAVGCLQVPLVDYVITSASSVMMVRMGEELRGGRAGAVLSIWRDTTCKLAVIFFPVVMLLVISGRELITVMFTANYAASVPLFMVWSTIILFATFQTDGALRVYADTKMLFVFSVIRLMILAALNFWCLEFFGLLGAVLFSIVGMAVYRGLCLYRIKHLMEAKLSELLPWKSLAITVGCVLGATAPVLILKSLVALPVLPRLILTGAAYTIFYLGLLHHSGQLDLRSLLDQIPAKVSHPIRIFCGRAARLSRDRIAVNRLQTLGSQHSSGSLGNSMTVKEKRECAASQES
jgi:O-antigen/teichoic acid export membrane protein